MGERVYIRRNRKKGRKLRLLLKSLCLMAGCFFLLVLLGKTVEEITRPAREKQGEFIPLQEAGNLAWLLADTAAQQGLVPDSLAENVLGTLKELDASQGGGYLTWQQAQAILSCFSDDGAGWSGGEYAKKERVLAGDWYGWFDEARKGYDPAGRIQDSRLTVLGVGADVRCSDGTPFAKDRIAAKEGERTLYADRLAMDSMRYRPLTVVERDGGLYAIRSVGTKSGLENAWIMEVTREGLTFFWDGAEICIEAKKDGGGADRMRTLLKEYEQRRDQVADLQFEDGTLCAVDFKTEKISGRLLSLQDGGVQIEGQGFYPFSEEAKVYRLYGRMQLLTPEDLRIGYSFTDFIVEDGQIAAALVSREEKMEKIRVLIRTAGYRDLLHDSVTVQPDCACMITAGEGEHAKQVKLSPKETLTVTADSPLFAHGGRIRIEPGVQTGRIRIAGLERSVGDPSYRGSLELVKSEGGIAVINEVLLEEYLYGVVPSEMPASYPLEALKSQAVCARTYAYSKMCRAGLPAYGAHADDSTGFQVYNNIEENTETTRAVKETKGEVLYYGEEPAQTYYYSTSCGYGTNAEIWGDAGAKSAPYLMAQAINFVNMDLTLRAQAADGTLAVMSPMADQAGILADEAAFENFLLEGQNSFYESREPWYRWTYEVTKLEEKTLEEAVRSRYAADPDGVLTLQEDGSFASKEPPSLGEILEMKVTARGSGGVANELEIRATNGTVLIKTEHNIRYVLCDGKTPVIRQDGSSAEASSMLPSAFFTLTAFKEDKVVVGYSLSGGGFGHGVGLSQNGAKNMASSGCTSDEILAFFYKGCSLETVY